MSQSVASLIWIFRSTKFPLDGLMHPITFPRPGSFPRGDPVLTPRQKQKSSMNGEGASRQGESKRRRLVFVVGEECGNAPALCQTALKGVKAHSASVGKRGADRAHTHAAYSCIDGKNIKGEGRP